ncbi:hypothetical protein V1517DRAFT_342172 [Lipomyces orientalis]|uniref:Uncharacterized protein n=1 Tax=Lipomyces orientalis TaxID=1233043 RepID=A0ACC3TDL2_9ASCO
MEYMLKSHGWDDGPSEHHHYNAEPVCGHGVVGTACVKIVMKSHRHADMGYVRLTPCLLSSFSAAPKSGQDEGTKLEELIAIAAGAPDGDIDLCGGSHVATS